MTLHSAAPEASAFDQPTIFVRAGQDRANPHHGTLTIDDWTVKCAVGRNGLVAASAKREGDGRTPVGCFPLRYGFYDPKVLGDAARDFAFPFKEKPQNYYWSEDPDSSVYNRLLLLRSIEGLELRDEHLFDLFVPIGWNDATPRAHAGSAIFLHGSRPDFSGTAGCVVVARDQLLEVARRLRPGIMIDIGWPERDAGARTVAHAEAPTALETVAFYGLAPGPRVLVTGAVHGSEPCGSQAIARAIDEFRAGKRGIARGSVTFAPVVNALAYRRNTRAGDRNLNRNLHEKPVPLSNEDRLCNVLCPLLRRHDVLVDLHSFSEGERPFALIGPADNAGDLEPFAHAGSELALARALQLDVVVHGWMRTHRDVMQARAGSADLDESARTHSVGTTEYMRFAGGYGVTVECGRHDDPNSVEVAYRTIFNALAHLGVSDDPRPEPANIRLLEIREELTAQHADDRLARFFDTGDTFREGEVIGRRASGDEIRAPYDGAMIFAGLQADPGTALSYLCAPSARLPVDAPPARP